MHELLIQYRNTNNILKMMIVKTYSTDLLKTNCEKTIEGLKNLKLILL